MNNLPEIISAEMRKQQLAYRDVASRAERLGFKIGHSTVHGYAKGTRKRYQRDHLKAIAAALGIPEQRLIDAAGMPRESEPFVLPDESSILTPEEREAIRGVVRTMIETRKQVMGNAEHPAPKTGAAGTAAQEPAPPAGTFGSGKVVHTEEDEEDPYTLAADYGDDSPLR